MIRIISNNFGIKVTCLLLAIGLWYAMRAEETVTVTLEVAVQPVLHERMVALSVTPPEIFVTLSGNRRILGNLELPKYQVPINLEKEMKSQVVRTALKSTDFSFPPGLSVARIEPEFVEIEIDRLAQKVFDVDPVMRGTVAPSFTLVQAKAFPSRLELTGPEKFLESIRKLPTEPINIDSLNTNFVQTVSITSPFNTFRGAEPVKVFVTISKAKVEKTFDQLPIRILQPVGPLMKCTMKPGTVNIRVLGSDIDFQGIGRASFIPYVDIAGLDPGVYDLPVHVVKREILRMVAIEPTSVEVTISG